MSEIDIANKFMVAAQGDSIVILNSPRRMTAEDAMVFAAWIVAMANLHSKHPFADYYEKVCNT